MGGLSKRCGCARRDWSRCRHPWHFACQWRGTRFWVSLDQYVGGPLKGKTQAQAAADKLREAIRSGHFPIDSDAAATTADGITLEAYTEIFLERYTKARQKVTWNDDRVKLGKIVAFPLPRIGGRLGSLPIGAITEDDCDVFLADLRARGLAASTRNKYLHILKAMSSWGVNKGYLTRPWIGPQSALKRERHARRSRRVTRDEEVRLLQEASPLLYRRIVGAVETGCRRGELSSLQWRDVTLERREFRVRAANAKNRRERYIPITSRLLAVLEMARHDPAGHLHADDAYVFGDEVGRRVYSRKKAWETAVLKAHGHTPTWRNGSLAPESSAVYGEIDLHFHDLRHEAGSRCLEAGLPLHHVKLLLGHTDISTTDTYLNASRIHLRESMLRLDRLEENATFLPHGETQGQQPASQGEG